MSKRRLRSQKEIEYEVGIHVKKANLVKDLLELSIFHPFLAINSGNGPLEVECLRSVDASLRLKKWAFNLLQDNVKETHEQTVGWDPELKWVEMTDEAARFLVVSDPVTKNPVAFSVFRFDMDYGEEVLYCYELHVSPDYQGRGIGRHMLDLLQALCRTYRMTKVILTVFKINERAISFYTRAKFSKDPTSPKDTRKIKYPYVILSKYCYI